jgi:hypothetical protein
MEYNMLKEHLSNCMQIPITRENHCYLPLYCSTMRVYQVSGSGIIFDACVLRQYSGPTHIAYSDMGLYNYVACMYGG